MVMTGRTRGWKGAVAVHSWVVIKRENDRTWSRYDVAGWGTPVRLNWWPPDLWFGQHGEVLADIKGGQAQYAAVQFLPNITAEWKITENGRVVLTFFYRDSYNYLNVGNHTTNSSGTSISYRRDFDRLDEFFKKKKKTDSAAEGRQ